MMNNTHWLVEMETGLDFYEDKPERVSVLKGEVICHGKRAKWPEKWKHYFDPQQEPIGEIITENLLDGRSVRPYYDRPDTLGGLIRKYLCKKWEYSNFNALDDTDYLFLRTNLFPYYPFLQCRLFTETEIKTLLLNSKGELRLFIQLTLFTGLKDTELINLKWSDTDFQNRRITVTSTLDSGNDQEEPKIRTLFFDRELEKLLTDLPKTAKYIFDDGKNQPLHTVNYYATEFGKLLKLLGIKKASLNTLRHSSVRFLRMNGWESRTINALLGQSGALFLDYRAQNGVNEFSTFIPIPKSYEECSKEVENLKDKFPEADLHICQIDHDKFIVYSRATYFFLLEQFPGHISGLVGNFHKYYRTIAPKDLAQDPSVEKALVRTAFICNPTVRISHYLQNFLDNKETRAYPSWGSDQWISDLCEVFKEQFWIAKKCLYFKMDGLIDKDFADFFEKTWKYSLIFSDASYNFSVTPGFSEKDIIRYVSLPRKFQNYRVIWQMIDWIVLQIAPRGGWSLDQIDPKRLQRWMRLLIFASLPMAKSITEKCLKNYGETAQIKDRDEILKVVVQKILELAQFQYNYWNLRLGKLREDQYGYYIHPYGILGELWVDTGELDKKSISPEAKAEIVKKSRWVRPSWFIWRKLQSIFLGRMEIDPLKRYAEVKQYKKVNGDEFVSIHKLAEICNCDLKTLRNWEKKGLIQFQRLGDKKMRWLKSDPAKIEQLRVALMKKKEIAQAYGLSRTSLKRIESELGTKSLQKLDRNAKLISHLEKRKRVDKTWAEKPNDLRLRLPELKSLIREMGGAGAFDKGEVIELAKKQGLNEKVIHELLKLL